MSDSGSEAPVTIKCSNCGFENEPGSRFCENCGRPLERRCPNCGNPASATAKFCRFCGWDLSESAVMPHAEPPRAEPSLTDLQRAAPAEMQDKIRMARQRVEGERKLVTALFADIVGSTALAAKLDPEDWRDVVNGAHQRMSRAVYRYEGTIAQLLGDGILAFFGAPLAHEDDAERAIRAGFDILEAIESYAAGLRQRGLASDLQVRIGVNTGLVVVGTIGNDLHMEYLALGDTVNISSRMQTAAEPGTILVTEDTHRQVSSLFEFDDVGPVDVKGIAEPVHVYRVVAERAGAVRLRGVAGLTSPMVARERELTTLLQVARDLRGGRGGIVSIVGEAGLGKSRLVAEWRAAVDAGDLHGTSSDDATSGESIRWIEGRCLSYGGSLPYHLGAHILRGMIGVPEDAPEDVMEEALHEAGRTFLGDGGREVAIVLAHMLGLPQDDDEASFLKYLEGPALQARYLAAYRSLLQAMAQQRPTVIIAEDVHWADPSSAALGAQLFPIVAHVPIVMVLVARPERDSPGWKLVTDAREVPGVGVLELHLSALAEADSCVLVDNLLRENPMPDDVRRMILDKAEGNPFYVEEVIRMLIDRGNGGGEAAIRDVEEIDIPDTLQGVISARLDRLPEETKWVLQVASVIGRQFPANVLEMVLTGRADDKT
jgi:class 3 adenylate cyclase